MARNQELLLLESVENLGIVGDIVRVKSGYARNYLLPMGLAEPPTQRKIDSLKDRRAEAEKEQLRLRGAREELLSRMEEITLTLIRSCNDQGVLYGSVTQRDLADGLQDNGYDVGTRSIRLAQPIRRVGEYAVPIQFDKDLRTDITVIVEPDQPLEERQEMEFDNEGNLIEPGSDRGGRGGDRRPRDRDAAPAEAAEAPAAG